MMWGNRARGLVGRGGSLSSLECRILRVFAGLNPEHRVRILPFQPELKGQKGVILPSGRGSAAANAYCNRYLWSAASLKNPVREVMPLPQLVSSTHLRNRLFSSANELGVQHQPGAPTHQGKMPFIDAFLFKMKSNPKLLMNKKIWSRRSMILPEFVNSSVRIYNGKNFIRRKITESMVGHKFGEFAFTRKRMKLKTSTVKKKAKKA